MDLVLQNIFQLSGTYELKTNFESNRINWILSELIRIISTEFGSVRFKVR